ncbi:MAG: DUF11 domain-containing protein [Cyanobacteriota bacterium]|nr:DUF11 domain-containing protein [Cyanobacteriota bacterium]
MNFWIASAQAEGSKDLVENGGDRPYTEWSTATSANIERKTRLKVFVKSGETVNLGSSVHNSSDGKDIVFRSPSGNEQVCNVLRNGTKEGFIDTVAKETAGPLPNAGGYTPCTFTATATGIYDVEFHSPKTSGDPPAIAATAQFPTDNKQGQAVAAWDITVRDSSGNPKTGRVFTNYIAMNMGDSGQSLNSEFFIQTKDGFLYRTAMNGIDPFGFIFFGNSRGFIDLTDNSTLYHSARATDNQLSPFIGNIQAQRPDVPDTPTDITHLTFFNPPDEDTLIELGIPLTPAIPATPTNFTFTGGNGGSGNQTFVGVGGNFSFDSISAGSYEIIIDTDEDGIFDPSRDRVLQNIASVGSNVVSWDGQDANGVNLGPRDNNDPYNARIRLRTGEYHFPMLDAENNPNGFVIEMQNPPTAFPNGFNEFTVYYDDDNYTTSNGTNVSLDGSGASNPRNAATGTNSSSGAHKFSGDYGDFKGIDTWSYFPSEGTSTNLIITNDKSANVRGTKSVRFLEDKDSSGTVTVGDIVEYTITYSNNAPATTDANNFVIQDDLPAQLTYNSSQIVSQTDGNTIQLNTSYNGSGALTNSGTLRVNDEITIKIVATINNRNSGNSIINQANATFNTPDNPAATGNALTDADSAGVTQDNPPTEGNAFKQIDDDSQNTGNDPSNTGDDEPTLINVEESPVTSGSPRILLVKRITAINGVDINEFVDDPNSTDDNNSNWPDSDPSNTNRNDFLRGAVNGGLVVPGDELEYTIYFLSTGETDASKLKICDLIPNNTTFLPTAFNGSTPTDGGLNTANLGIAISLDNTNFSSNPTAFLTNLADGDRGEFFAAGKTPSMDCSGSNNGANNNGAVIVNIVNQNNPNQDIIPTANIDQSQTKPTSSYGFIRFKVKVD